MKHGHVLLLAMLIFLIFLPNRAYSSDDLVIVARCNGSQNKMFLSISGDISEANKITDKRTVDGEIDPETFRLSIPSQMILGQIYRVLVVVRNIGSNSGNFTLVVSSPIDYVLILAQERNERNYAPDEILVGRSGNTMISCLKPGEQYTFAFPMMALQSHAGSLYITASLFTTIEFQGAIELSKVVAEIREIKTGVPGEWLTVLIFLVFVICAMLVVKFLKPQTKDVLIIASLFAISIALRWQDLANLSLYPDEVTYISSSISVLLNNWMWPKTLMLGYPPLFFYLLAVLVRFFGPQLFILRAVSVVFGSLSVCVVYLLGKELFDRRVGLLAAILLGLSSFHILYSRILMTEGLETFLILMSVFLFVKGFIKQRNKAYLFASGAFIGLSISTKYLGLTIYVAIILFLVWTQHRSWKFSFKKEYLLIVSASIMVLLPTLVPLALNRANPIWYWTNLPFQEATKKSMPISDLVVRGYESYMNLFTRGMQALSWAPSYLIISSVFLFIAVFYNLIGMLKSRKSESLLICFFAVNALAAFLFPIRHAYYLLYSIPFYLLMLSHFAISCWRNLRSRWISSEPVKFMRNLNSGLMKVFVLGLICIFFFSYSVVGVLEPFTDRGEFDGYRQVSLFAKTRIRSGEVVGAILSPMFQYYFGLYGVNSTLIELMTVAKFVEPVKDVFLPDEYKFDFDTLRVYNPRYILASGIWYERIVTAEDRTEILASYRVVFKSTVRQDEEAPLVLERL